MKKVFMSMVIILGVSLMFNTTVFGASADYRFMHNDHDTLIIGEITELTSKKMVIRAADYVVSKSYMSLNDEAKKLLRPKTATIAATELPKRFDTAAVGDYVLASLDKENDKKDNIFNIKWGLFKVDSLDYKTLKVEASSEEMSAIYTDFVNSGGVHTIFTSHGNRVTRNGENGKEIVVYEEKSNATISGEKDNSEISESPIDRKSVV